MEEVDEETCFETVEDEFLTGEELMARIECWTLKLLKEGTPKLSMVKLRSSNVAYSKEGKVRMGSERQLRRMGCCSVRAYLRTWIVVAKVHALVSTGRCVTQRGLYYSLVAFFEQQEQLNAIVEDVGAMLRVSRAALGIVAESRGKLGGLACFSPDGAPPIPLRQLGGIRISQLDARCVVAAERPPSLVLVVEKDAIFQRLLSDRIFDRIPMVLLTGSGYPDLATKHLLAALHRNWGLPVAGLFDYNPDGLQIFLSYRCGTIGHGLHSRSATVPIRLLGVAPQDLAADWAFTPLTPRETALAGRLQRHPAVARSEGLLAHLEGMRRHGTAEIEAVVDPPAPPTALEGAARGVLIPKRTALVELICRKLHRRKFID